MFGTRSANFTAQSGLTRPRRSDSPSVWEPRDVRGQTAVTVNHLRGITSMASERLHIVPHEQGWALKREGANKIESTHPTQKEAIDAGRTCAQQEEVDLVVHRQDGTFRNVLTYTNEPMSERTSERTNGNRTRAELH